MMLTRMAGAFLACTIGTLLILPVQAGVELAAADTITSSGIPRAVTLADMNNDNLADVITAEDGLPGVVVHLSNSATTREYTLDAAAMAVLVADMDASGTPDIVALDRNNAELIVILLDADGDELSRHEFATTATPSALSIAMLNGDAYPELLVLDSQEDSLAVFVGDEDDVLLSPVAIATGNYPVAMAVEDFDQDGHQDVFVLNMAGSSVGRLMGAGDGSLVAATAYPVPFGPSAINDSSLPEAMVAGDIDADGYPDLVVASLLGNTLSSFINDGLGGFSGSTVLSNDWREVSLSYSVDASGEPVVETYVGSMTFDVMSLPLAMVDLDADGHLDLVAAGVNDTRITLFPGSVSGFVAGHRFVVDERTWSLATGDAAGADGRDDIAVIMPDAGKVKVLQNSTSLYWPPAAIDTTIDIEECSSDSFGFQAADNGNGPFVFSVVDIQRMTAASTDSGIGAGGTISLGDLPDDSGVPVSEPVSVGSGLRIDALDPDSGEFVLVVGDTGSATTETWKIDFAITDASDASSTGSILATISGDGAFEPCGSLGTVFPGSVELVSGGDIKAADDDNAEPESEPGQSSDTATGSVGDTASSGGGASWVVLLLSLVLVRRREYPACG